MQASSRATSNVEKLFQQYQFRPKPPQQVFQMNKHTALKRRQIYSQQCKRIK
jgi:hypothetical protein